MITIEPMNHILRQLGYTGEIERLGGQESLFYAWRIRRGDGVIVASGTKKLLSDAKDVILSWFEHSV